MNLKSRIERVAVSLGEHEAGEAKPHHWKTPDAAAIEDSYQGWFPAIAPQVFTHAFEWFHCHFLDWYWPLLKLRAAGLPVPENLPLAALLALGRGLGKSALLEGIALAEGAHFGRSFGLYVSSTKDKTGEHLQNVRSLIEGSEIARYYPGLAQPRIGKFGNQRGWRADALYTASGFTLIAASLEQGVRGLRDLELRPTFVEFDDIDERDDSPGVKQEKFDTLRKDVLPMLAPFGLAVFAQNLIYAGSLMDDTISRRLDWFHLRHQTGVVNTFQDDLDIQKVDGRPIIVAGTPNWSRIDRAVAQDMLNKMGDEAFMVECQNVTAPAPEKLVWTGFSEAVHVITWAQFKAVFKTDRIPAHWFLYGGYDAGTTGPERHPAVISIATVSAENGPLAGDIFIFYEYVATAGEIEDDLARALLTELAELCDNYGVQQAAAMVAQSDQPQVSEKAAWQMRRQAGALVPFRLFNGSHEASSERLTLQRNWGLPIRAGKGGKTEGLPQLRFYLKAEPRPHPFQPELVGKPNLFLVVANDQARAARDRFGLARHRWEAANLKYDPNVTARDVPLKLGDDATDAVKHYLQTFALVATPLSQAEMIERELPENLRQPALRRVIEEEGALSPGQEMALAIQTQAARRRVDARRGEYQFIAESGEFKDFIEWDG